MPGSIPNREKGRMRRPRRSRVIHRIRPPSLAFLVVAVIATTGFMVPSGASAQSTPGWTVQLPTSSQLLSSISCATATSCVAVGSNGLVGTSDGGTTWVNQSAPGGPLTLSAASCSTATNCVAVGSDAIISTADGGKTWQAQAPPATTDNFASVSCSSSTNCTAVGQDSVPRRCHCRDDGWRCNLDSRDRPGRGWLYRKRVVPKWYNLLRSGDPRDHRNDQWG